MPDFPINNNVSLRNFERSLSQNDDQGNIIISGLPALSLGSRIVNFISGNSQTSDRIYQLFKEEIRDHIATKWGVQYGNDEEYAIDTVAIRLLEECGLSRKNLKTISAAKQIFQSVNAQIESVVNYPLGVDLTLIFDGSPKTEAANMLKMFLGASLTLRVNTWQFNKALFWSKNPEITQGLRTEIQSVLVKCCRLLNTVSPDQEASIQAVIGNLLSLIPYTDPDNGSSILVPQKVANEWKLRTYKTCKIPLTPKWLGTQLFALSLEPIVRKSNKLLIFPPTLYPALSGSLLSAISTTFPGHTAGGAIYDYFAKDAISKLLENQENVAAYGLSLGGAMALLAVCDHPNKFSEVHVFGSPAPWGRHLANYERLVDKEKKPNVQVFCNQGDHVLDIGGGYHRDWNIHTMIHPKKQTGLDILFVHGTINSSFSKAIRLKRSAEIDSKSANRLLMNIIHQTSAVLTFPATLTVLAISILKGSTGLLFEQILKGSEVND